MAAFPLGLAGYLFLGGKTEAPPRRPLRLERAAGDKGRSSSRRGFLPGGRALREEEGRKESPATVHSSRFTSRDSVIAVLEANGIRRREIEDVLRVSRFLHPLSRIAAGGRYQVAVDGKGLRGFLVQVDKRDQLRVYRAVSGGLRARMERIPYQVERVRLEGVVRGSLFQSVAKSGGSPALVMKLAEIFGWVIDFHKDLREGDRFRLLLERRFLDGGPAGFGRILLADLHVGGKKYSAIFSEQGEGRGDYFTPEGATLRRAFFRSPLRYTRISSRFSKSRFHPLLKRYRPHYGIDYAAPAGTPVRAVADGLIEFARWNGAAGKMVRIRHGWGYRTSYLHLSRFGRGIRVGRKVRQGRLIGYVGSTGLSTGPHLDYRITRRGRPLDPLTAKLPAGKPLPESERERFRRLVRERRKWIARAPALRSGEKMASAEAPLAPTF